MCSDGLTTKLFEFPFHECGVMAVLLAHVRGIGHDICVFVQVRRVRRGELYINKIPSGNIPSALILCLRLCC